MSTSRFRKGTIAAIAAVALAVTGCSAEPGPANSDGELVSLKVGVLPYANVATLYVGVEEGIFEKHGFEIEPVIFQSGSEEVTALVAGELDVAFIGYFTAAVPISRGLPIQMIGHNDGEASEAEDAWAALTLVAADSDIHSVKDLEGRTLGVNALRSQSEAQNHASFEAQGVDPSKVHLIEVPMPEMAAALANGSVDAITIAEPFASPAIANGARLIDAPMVSITPEGGNFPNGGWVARTETINDGDMIERLVEALAEATDFTQANPDRARAIIPQYTAMTPEQVDAIKLPVWNSRVDRELVQLALDLANSAGLLAKEVSIEDLLAPSAQRFR